MPPHTGKGEQSGLSWAKQALLAPNKGSIVSVGLWSGPKTLHQQWQVKMAAKRVHQCCLLGVQGSCLEMCMQGRRLCATSRLCYVLLHRFPKKQSLLHTDTPSHLSRGCLCTPFPPPLTPGSPLPPALLQLFHPTPFPTFLCPPPPSPFIFIFQERGRSGCPPADRSWEEEEG